VSLPDRVRVHPSPLAGEVLVPGDKSLSHRALMVPALCGGPVAVGGLAPGADVLATAAALRALGVRVELEPDGVDLAGEVEGDLGGPGPGADGEPVALDCGNSGTSLRLLAGLAAGAGRAVRLDGDASLRRRPVDRVAAPLRAAGVTVAAREDRLPPLVVRPTGRPRGLAWDSPVASAQVKSAVLLCGLGADGPSVVRSPAPSRDHTERLLRHAGIAVDGGPTPDGREEVTVAPGRPRLEGVAVARDPSAAAFWHVAAACGAGTVTTPGLCLNEGRTGALDVLRALGADVRVTAAGDRTGEPTGTVTVAPGSLVGAVVAGATVVRTLDELPVLALAGAMSEDGLEVRDAAELRHKESDRIRGVVALLGAVGMRADERPDGFVVPGGQRPVGGRVVTDGDHRIAMTAALAGVLGTAPVEVAGFATVASSYPGFLADLERLGGRVEVLDG
jgi:3-phosphoshikimate 1-carboxyvinyltransferase